MTRKIHCRKCNKEFETEEIVCTQQNYVIKGTKIPATYTRVKNSKCELCRNVGKALDFLNSIMEKGN